MSLLLSHLKSYDANAQNIQNSKQVNTTSSTSQVSNMKELIKGEVLKGEIVDLRNNQAVIRMNDGSIVQGRMEHDVDLYIGQNASFEVVKNNESEIQLKIVPEQVKNPNDSLAEKALQQAALPMSQKNKEVVSALLDANLSVDKQSILKFLKVVHQFPEAGVKELAFLQKHSIPVNEANVAMVKEYQNSEHRIMAQLESIADGLCELLGSGIEDGQAMKLFQFVMNRPQYDSANIQPDIQTAKQAVNPAAGQPLSESNPQTEPGSLQTGHPAQQSMTMTSSDVPTTLLLAAMHPMSQPETQGIAVRFFPEQRSQLAAALKEAGMSGNVLEKVISGEIGEHELLQEIYEFVGKKCSKEGAKSILHQLMSREDLQQMAKDELLKNYTMSPKELETEGTVKKYYEKLQHDLNQMTEVLKEAAHQESASRLSGQSEHLKQNLDFMKTLNQIYPYVQLPVRLKNQTIHSELYVFTKMKGKLKNAENISLLLHLDMDAIGAIDIHLKLNQKSLRAQFYVQDEEVQEMFETTIQELEQALGEKGYYLASEFHIQEKKEAVIEEMIVQEQASEGMTMKRFTFDVRA